MMELRNTFVTEHVGLYWQYRKCRLDCVTMFFAVTVTVMVWQCLLESQSDSVFFVSLCHLVPFWSRIVAVWHFGVTVWHFGVIVSCCDLLVSRCHSVVVTFWCHGVVLCHFGVAVLQCRVVTFWCHCVVVTFWCHGVTVSLLCGVWWWWCVFWLGLSSACNGWIAERSCPSTNCTWVWGPWGLWPPPDTSTPTQDRFLPTSLYHQVSPLSNCRGMHILY
jgi:hypothetical protein